MTEPTTIRVLPKQKLFIASKAKYPAFIGGVGSGKTYSGCLRALLRLNAGMDGMVIAPTYPMMRDVVQRTFLEWADRLEIGYNFSKSEEKVEISGAVVLFRSADQPDRLRGPNLNWAYLDEAALMSERTWKVVLGRLRIGEPSAWVTTTPAGMNWVWKNWVERADPAYELIRATSPENTFLPSGYVEDMRANYTGEFAKQEIEGDFVAFEGLVYSEFDRGVHVAERTIGEGWGRLRSIDYGYTNPFVCLWGAVDEDGRLHIYDEHYRAKTLIRDHAEAIRRRTGSYRFTVADHDAQDSAEMGSVGIATRPAQKDVIRGIQKLKARLAVQADGRPRLTISPKCANLIREFSSYRWSESRENRNEKEEPVKENDHAMDCLRYMCMELDNKKVFIYA
jgi:PBSX family phage terminase large subunit